METYITKRIEAFWLFFMLCLACAINMSCTHDRSSGCKSSDEFRLHYFNCINTVLLLQNGCDVPNIDVGKSYEMLELLTGCKSLVVHTDIPFIYNDTTWNSLNKDLDNWILWYNQNGLKYDMCMVDSILFEYRKHAFVPDYTDTLYISKLRVIKPDLDCLALVIWDRQMQAEYALSFPTFPPRQCIADFNR